MKVGIDFKDIASYNENMSKGLVDKMFFLNDIELNNEKKYLFVDFGCADGFLTDALYDVLSKRGIAAYYVGYDISEDMIDLAKTRFNHNATNVMFTYKWDEVIEYMKQYENTEKVLILSSVIHEVYSYSKDPQDIKEFWQRVLESDFKYICVRDMMVAADIDRPSNLNDVGKIIAASVTGNVITKEQLADYELKNNRLEYSQREVIHFLLKYRWKLNWEREVNENYFPITVEEFLEFFEGKYEINYLERFRVPFLDKCIKEDFDIELEDYTHIKAVFEKIKEG